MFNRIGVIGAGAMGRGIAQLFASSGQQVLLFDTRAEAIEDALAFNRNLLQRQLAKGKLSEAEFEATCARMQPAAALTDLKDCDLVIEAIVEILEVKQKLFADLEAIVSEGCLLATNTSSLSVTRIAAGCSRPERVAGFHFFNPVPLMKIVEVVRGSRTDERYIKGLVELAEKAGHFPAITPDTPGFLVNHAGRAFGTEALRMLSEGVATVQQIDRILRDGPGFRMGPFELFDLTGLDVSHAVMESVYEQFYHDPRYTPSFIAGQRVAAGLLGRKTSQGFYRYEDGQKIEQPEPAVGSVLLSRPYWLQSDDEALRNQVAQVLANAGATLETGEQPSAEAICLITPLGEDCTAALTRLGLPAERTLALDSFASWDKRRTLMRQPAADADVVAQARQALGADGVPVEVINDSPGFVIQRLIASVVNLGCEIAQKGIATPDTLDRAIQLALGYPKGPLGFGEHYGKQAVLTVLNNMQAVYGEPRYRPSPWLRRRVQLGLPLTTPDFQE
ncbi:3-hydroxybutyryl-CoA dehydrogenase [Halopseudomonas formosensis]|uniref:3-hydroxybutyryl-CoA dehydrogenase n=1 Tax=Halopseudomonas formosensis TaxID=1002526 RepID=A0A1I6C730_9GAMM|nr:3-hydroxyacyl-CoA dehydrogenase [Halopseudomonas formosensis]SFQ88996.1 3-hydroxybutyryl-CoA dehydrogenase [Halopseudomonas formosensis]